MMKNNNTYSVRWPDKSSGAFAFVLIFLLHFLHQGKKVESIQHTNVKRENSLWTKQKNINLLILLHQNNSCSISFINRFIEI
jgi:hypothetical protein